MASVTYGKDIMASVIMAKILWQMKLSLYLEENQGQFNGDDFIFPVLFNTIIEKNLFASKFSPRAGVLRSPAIYMINHNNDIFVQVKKGESVGKLVSLSVTCQDRQPATKASGVQE